MDGAGNPAWILRAAVETVAELLRSGVPTLVCCGAGLSRAPCIAGTAIALVRGCSLADGLAVACEGARGDVSPALWAAVQDCAVKGAIRP
jgi:protein-tyrosine phosphatase